jgi:ABC-type Fe3+ transport system substrate-binding protein
VLDPRFKERFAATTAKCGACYAALHMFLDPAMKDRYPPDFLQRIAAQKPAVYSDFLAMVDRVVAGENDFAYWSFESIAATKRAQGAPVRWVYPKPTPSFPSTWMAVSAHAPHPNAARLFLNWAGSEDGANAFQLQYLAATTIKGVPDRRPFTKEDWYKPMTESYRVDFQRWEKSYSADLDKWIRTLQSSR